MFRNTLFIFFTIIISYSVSAQTAGTLTVSTSTSITGGNYAPKNIIAIWVEDEEGNFIKTLLSYAQTRITHLNIWQASTAAAGSEFNTVDAITGATRSNHSTRTCTWDVTDINGTLVNDGNYTVWMELTDKNGTGNFSSFPIIKSIDPQFISPANVPSFASITIDWVPTTSSISNYESNKGNLIYPNPTSGVFTIVATNLKTVEIWDIYGHLVYTNTTSFINISDQPVGVYFIKISNNEGTFIQKIIKY